MTLLIKSVILLVTTVFVLNFQLTTTNGAIVGTWNIQNFGTKKAADKIMMKKIIEITKKFDLVAIQEISDVKEKVMAVFLDYLDKSQGSKSFKMLVSKRVGGGGFAEQYAVLYNSKVFKVTEEGIYDGTKDFKRPPYFVTVSSRRSSKFQFGFGTIHTSPPLAVEEISNLADASDWYMKKTGIKNVMILGDYNCGCSYVRPKQYNDIELYTRRDFHWLIPSTFDTTVSSKTDCPYDRIVVAGKSLFSTIVPESEKVLNFQEMLSLNEDEALKISDHFPVLLEMRESKMRSTNDTEGEVVSLDDIFESPILEE